MGYDWTAKCKKGFKVLPSNIQEFKTARTMVFHIDTEAS